MATTDAVLTPAVDAARAAAVEAAGGGDLVGDHLGSTVEDDRVVSHLFASNAPGYAGWHWTVTLARVPRGRRATVSEVHLLPGDDAVLAPVWVPWAERLQPGDVGPGDVLPLLPDDERLDQGYEATGDDDADRVAIYELGLGRERVLSHLGRAEAATRWYAGSHGPTAPQAIASAAPCSTCGFFVLLAGSLRGQFGVCANEWSPDDGRVVSLDHGCGAHSQTDVPYAPSEWPAPPSPLDGIDVVRNEPTPQPDAAPAADEPTPEPDAAPAADEPTPEPDAAPAADAPAPEQPSPAASKIAQIGRWKDDGGAVAD